MRFDSGTQYDVQYGVEYVAQYGIRTLAQDAAGMPNGEVPVDRLLCVDEAAAALATSPRFVRRLVAERRIRFIKIGKHVRISSTDLDAFVTAGRVEPQRLTRGA